ncbi:MAG: tRNA 2-thiouridine(34) synthase MnmA [Smithellaceae bacterium]|nr:tRNA 2-thiouridine(34) synthase MnmA [Smithellaceae bacterium]
MIAMSGGVDSSVAAFLLKEQGYDVTGVTMCMGVTGEEGRAACCGAEAIADARRVCDRLRVPHHVIDYADELENSVIRKFKEEYLRGRTPNPCVDCNRYLKFGSLLKRALALGFDCLATGHYACLEKAEGEYYLKKARDLTKDQTYFLYPIARQDLPRLLFPLAPYVKEEVRELARRAGLPTADKGESQDICFMPKGRMDSLFTDTDDISPGDIVDTEGKILGRHRGIVFYTVGQRTGLGISHPEPRYVLSVEAARNRLVVGSRYQLKSKELLAGDCNFLVADWPSEVTAKIRYRKKESPCVTRREGDRIRVTFREAQEAATPGQAIVFYDGDLVLGGGVIEEVMGGH